MVANATNWTYVDFMREPSGGGILRMGVQPYLDALGDFGFIFYGILVSLTMGIAYQRTRDIYAPLFVLLISGAVLGNSGLLSDTMRNLGNLIIALSIAGIVVKLWWSRQP